MFLFSIIFLEQKRNLVIFIIKKKSQSIGQFWKFLWPFFSLSNLDLIPQYFSAKDLFKENWKFSWRFKSLDFWTNKNFLIKYIYTWKDLLTICLILTVTEISVISIPLRYLFLWSCFYFWIFTQKEIA